MGNDDIFIIAFIIALVALTLFFFFYLSFDKGDKKEEANFLIDYLSKHDDMWERSTIIEVVEKFCRVKYDFFYEFPPEYFSFWSCDPNFEKCPLEILDEKLTFLKSKPHIFEYNSNSDSILLSRLCLPWHIDIVSIYIFNDPNKDDFCVVSALYYTDLYFINGGTDTKQKHYFLCRKKRNAWLIEEINYGSRSLPIKSHVKHPDLINLLLKRNKKQFLYNSILILAISLIFALLLQNVYIIAAGFFIGIFILFSRWLYRFPLKFLFTNDRDLYNWERIYNLP